MASDDTSEAQISAMTATASATLPELTLIVAATSRNMGIGLGNALPWSGLRREMAYFRRVTSRAPNPVEPTTTTTTTSTTASRRRNAVIMGRKTWDGIPPRFRPLAGRVNVVVSRSHAPTLPPPSLPSSSPATAGGEAGAGGAEDDEEAVVRASSLADALDRLARRKDDDSGRHRDVGRVFVIGGAQLYAAALGLPQARRVLLTRVEREFECDVFFPLRLGGDGSGGEAGGRQGRWVKRSKEELDKWVGEEVPAGVQEENGTRYEFEMWERVD